MFIIFLDDLSQCRSEVGIQLESFNFLMINEFFLMPVISAQLTQSAITKISGFIKNDFITNFDFTPLSKSILQPSHLSVLPQERSSICLSTVFYNLFSSRCTVRLVLGEVKQSYSHVCHFVLKPHLLPTPKQVCMLEGDA